MKTLGFTRTYKDETENAVRVMEEGEKQVVLLGHIDIVPRRDSYLSSKGGER